MISIILPTYNRARTIKRAVISVLEQTYEDLELLIIDDGSTDNTKEIVSQIKDARVRYIELEQNHGACKARNRGITEAMGEYIAFQDSDDEWLPEKLEKQLNAMHKYNADIVYCAMRRYSPSGEKWEKYPRIVLDYDRDIRRQFLVENMAGCVALLIKKTCFQEEKFDETMPRLQDWDLMVRFAGKFKIIYLDKLLINSYLQNDSISSNPQKGAVAFQIMYNNNSDLIESDKQLKALFKQRIGDKLLLAGNDCTREYREALKCKFSIVVMIRLVAYKLGFQNVLIRLWKRKYYNG